uniref:Aminopeptidase P N-terminal domain-containing protein n=1 Tax=Chromera velia CCMP2878 TaxID=1169474 RepID=A0A0G4I505_9ALVE|eukprot:Cvel_35961.t1-p1 / transcript=Cvel_35961.t1 / gene=Cvel_35961 / organism=Chromera_velia_CCMP2878 / gene_product=Xaa-Pro dipeptidase, putative / transcript_product=Xaa-Pro dipeptidase, putative / location=Cvel_scaffold6827:257-2053(-) / protein_length=195 / sequence_SO=supercontig / SO=protein_coding / is_pseudo=false
MSAAKKVKTSHAAANGGGVHANGGISGMGAVDADRYSYLASNDAVRKITTETRAQLLKMAEGKLSKENSAICLAGGKSGQWDFYDNDTTWTFFRQEPYFRYLFGVNEPDLFGFICLSSGLSVLFIPKIPEEVWRVTGVPPTLEEYRQTYGLGQVHYLEDMNKVLQDLGLKKLFVMKGTNTDSGIETVTRPEFEGG